MPKSLLAVAAPLPHFQSRRSFAAVLPFLRVRRAPLDSVGVRQPARGASPQSVAAPGVGVAVGPVAVGIGVGVTVGAVAVAVSVAVGVGGAAVMVGVGVSVGSGFTVMLTVAVFESLSPSLTL